MTKASTESENKRAKINVFLTQILGKGFSFQESFKTVLGCDLGSAVSPTALGGGYVKLAMFIQKGMTPGSAASVMTLSSVEDITFFVLALPIAILLTSAQKLPLFHELKTLASEIKTIPIILLLCGGLVLSALLMIRSAQYNGKLKPGSIFAKIYQRVHKFWYDFKNVYLLISRKGKLRFAITLFLTGILWICRYSVILALFACLHVPIQPVKFFIFQWIIFFITTFTPTPGGAVGAEASFYFIYQSFIPANIIGIAATGWRFLTFYLQAGIALVLFTLIHIRDKG